MKKKIVIISGVLVFICGVITIIKFSEEITASLVNRLLIVTKHTVNFRTTSPYVSRRTINKVLAPSLGKNILDVDAQALERELRKNEWISSVAIEKVFPNELSVDVTTHQALGIVVLDRLYYINENFELFKKVQNADDHNFMYITGLFDNKDLDNDALKECLIYIEKNKGLLVSELHVDKNEGITLYMMDSVGKVLLGIDNFTKKLEHLALIHDDLQKKNIDFQFINLSSLDQGVVKKMEL